MGTSQLLFVVGRLVQGGNQVGRSLKIYGGAFLITIGFPP